MNTKGFMLLLFGVLVLGGGLGGSFIAGLGVGKGQKVEAAPVIVPSLPAPSSAAAQMPITHGVDGQGFANFRQRAQSGELSQDDQTTLREQFQSRFSGTGDSAQFAGRSRFGGSALTGTVIAVEGNVLTLDTAQGILQVSVGEDVTIRQSIDIAIENLADGTRITVIGQLSDDGGVTADAIQVIPEGQDFTTGGWIGQ